MPISLPAVWHVEHLELVGYLLNLDHPHGRAKARSFLRNGFSPENPEWLAAALFEHCAVSPWRVVETGLSTRFVFEGPLTAPAGIMPRLRSVWLSDEPGVSARLLTAYPFDERET